MKMFVSLSDPKLKNRDVRVDSEPESDEELSSTLPPCMPFSSPLRRDSSFLTAKSMSSQYTLPVDPNYLPKYAMDEPDRFVNLFVQSLNFVFLR